MLWLAVLAAADAAASGGDGKPADGTVVFAPPSFAELFKGSPFYATSAALVEGAKVCLPVPRWIACSDPCTGTCHGNTLSNLSCSGPRMSRIICQKSTVFATMSWRLSRLGG
jgi:hypothetical protein